MIDEGEEEMRSAKASAVSGCVVWLLSIGIISRCILPIDVVAGSITSFSQFAIKPLGNSYARS